jgi:hypothetical protein
MLGGITLGKLPNIAATKQRAMERDYRSLFENNVPT